MSFAARREKAPTPPSQKKYSFKTKSRFADRGKVAEGEVQKYLEVWSGVPGREYNRLVDSKAAGRTIKAAAADFEFYSSDSPLGAPAFGLIEVKETEHEYRLARDKVPQLPRLRKRAKCGGLCMVLVLHSTLGKWRCVPVEWLHSNGDKGSWNLTDFPLNASPEEALKRLGVWP